MSDFTNSGGSDSGFGRGDAPDQRPVHEEAAPAAIPAPTPGLISSSSAPAGGRVFEVWSDTNDQIEEQDPAIDEPMQTATVELSAAERRVLGALIEKSYLTPDIYPMTTNALVTASNQKTNRDPVVDYSAVVIDSTLMELRQRNLVRRVHSSGSRSTKHRQTLDEALVLSERELALTSVLLLRGPQTIGELRIRTERHDVGFDGLGAVEDCLEALASRATPLVVQLSRQPGHKENRWQHLLSGPDAPEESSETGHLSDSAAPSQSCKDQRTQHAAPSQRSDATTAVTATAASDVLVARVSELEAQVKVLQRQLATLAEKLGEPLE